MQEGTKRDLNPSRKKLEQRQGMTNATPLGKLFVSLIPTKRELQLCGSRLQYQQIIVFNIIEEFGFDTIAIVQPTPKSSEKSAEASAFFQGFVVQDRHKVWQHQPSRFPSASA
jgi:hypothetical protein